jgi:non-canonical purine NTP pyrophosphatase (RdgB/HAM1 family)
MTRAPFVLVTGNRHKLLETRRLLAHHWQDLEHVDVDLPEPQSLDLRAVLKAKGNEAWRTLGRPLVVEETGLELEALNGFPGPLVKWMLAAVGAEGIARVALALGNANATARCALLYHDGVRQWLAEGVTPGTLVLPGRGHSGFGWDPVFQPLGEKRTYSELGDAEKDETGHRGRAWRELLRLLGDPAASGQGD